MKVPFDSLSFFIAITAGLVSCAPLEASRVETIELHESGGFSYNVVVHADGRGVFDGNPHRLRDYRPPFPEKGRRSFSITPAQFQDLQRALAPYLRKAKPVTEESFNEIITGMVGCSPGLPMGDDFGALYLRWQGPRMNVHTVVEFGCDPDRRAEEYARLRKAVQRLPLQRFLGDFG